LHEVENFICKAFKGNVVAGYFESLIMQQMGASGSLAG
jgi:hypothetical protein